MTQFASRRSRSDYQQYRAPKIDGSLLVHPSEESLSSIAIRTFQDRQAGRYLISLAGKSLDSLSEQARSELVTQAVAWTASYEERHVELPSQSCPMVLSGHQPELFHPGVWFKNFLLAGLAQQSGGIGVNLIIDSDLCRDVSLNIPLGEYPNHYLETVRYDDPVGSMPFEERTVQNEAFFESFSNRVSEQELKSLTEGSILESLWPLAIKQSQQGMNLGNAVSSARHQLERKHGSQTLELPISHVADTNSFRHFLFEILSRADEFRLAYNESLSDYRVAHKLRTPAQPLPDLGEEGDWIETPFWVWTEDQPTRKPLWCADAHDRIQLSFDQGALPIGTISDNPQDAIQQLEALRTSGVKIRSRALTTTLYCRWVLADLFIHGIGGAKYDQITDEISLRFFGEVPPQHATATATVRLIPPNPNEVQSDQLSLLKQRIRSYRFHPEDFLDEKELSPELMEAAQQKQHAIQMEKTFENAKQRHQLIEQANLLLSGQLTARIQADHEKLHRLVEEQKRQPISTSREYSFVLFNEMKLVDQLQQLVEQANI